MIDRKMAMRSAKIIALFLPNDITPFATLVAAFFGLRGLVTAIQKNATGNAA